MHQTPRIANIILGVWLFISAFLWQHTAVQMMNTWIIGIIVVVFAAWAMVDSRMRYVNTAVAVWLFFSTIFFPAISSATVWNNILVAVAIFVFSLIQTRHTQMQRRTPQQRTPMPQS